LQSNSSSLSPGQPMSATRRSYRCIIDQSTITITITITIMAHFRHVQRSLRHHAIINQSTITHDHDHNHGPFLPRPTVLRGITITAHDHDHRSRSPLTITTVWRDNLRDHTTSKSSVVTQSLFLKRRFPLLQVEHRINHSLFLTELGRWFPTSYRLSSVR